MLVNKAEPPAIELTQLAANIDWLVYALYLLAIFALLGLCNVQERIEPHAHTNTLWQWIVCVQPANCAPPPHQRGATRKVLILTAGFIVLMATSLYQGGQLNSLLVGMPDGCRHVSNSRICVRF